MIGLGSVGSTAAIQGLAKSGIGEMTFERS